LEESWTFILWGLKTYVFESWTFNSLDLLKYGISLCATSLQKYTKLSQLLDVAAYGLVVENVSDFDTSP
jgi:hypothetical protein